MKKRVTFICEFLKGRLIQHNLQTKGNDYYEKNLKCFNDKPLLSAENANEFIKQAILSDRPFMAGRFGATELATVKTFDFENKSRYKAQLNRIGTTAGLFPETEEIGKRFADIMIESVSQADLMGIWPEPFEEYYLHTYGDSKLECTLLRNLEPWLHTNNPWSAALAGKKVLIVGIFSESVKEQYRKRESIFPDTEVLPEFTLITYQSVWTSHGCDPRFKDWFEALDFMKKEILERSFDVAILGCGAYGFPLAAEIKKAGKQAIHLGGATQLLFGITGTRWEDDPRIQALVNENWVRPMKSEKPKQADEIENAAYW